MMILHYLEFISCSYLGLHNDKEIINAIKNSTDLDLQGFLFSSSRTRAVSQLESSVLEIIIQNFLSIFTIVISEFTYSTSWCYTFIGLSNIS